MISLFQPHFCFHHLFSLLPIFSTSDIAIASSRITCSAETTREVFSVDGFMSLSLIYKYNHCFIGYHRK